MHCLDVQTELQVYVDEDLSLERAALLERHLAGCEACRAELARLRAVVAALETWPLVAEPSRLTTRVMAQVKPRPALPHFRLRWSDLAVSTVGGGLAFVAILVWRNAASNDLIYLYFPQVHLWLEMLRLKALLWIQDLIIADAIPWGLAFVGFTLTVVLALAVWGQGALYSINGWSRTAASNTTGT